MFPIPTILLLDELLEFCPIDLAILPRRGHGKSQGWVKEDARKTNGFAWPFHSLGFGISHRRANTFHLAMFHSRL